MMRIGMDTGQVRMMASRLRREADAIDGHMAGIRASVEGANWQSQAREEYVSNLEALLRVNAKTTQAMRLMAQSAERKAEQWEMLASKFNGPFEFIGDIWRNLLDHLNNTWQGIINTIGKIAIPIFIFIPVASQKVGDWFDNIEFPWEEGAWPPSWAPWLKSEGTAPNTQAPEQQTPDTNGDVGEGVKVEPAPVAPSKPVLPVELSQTDGRWKDVTMGSEDDETIYSAGCLITSVAIIARQMGADVTPVDVDAFLDKNNGYTDNSKSSYMKQGYIEKYLESTFPGRDFTSEIISNKDVVNAIKDGKKLIVHVESSNPDGHWVVAEGINEKGEIMVIDPRSGTHKVYPVSKLYDGGGTKAIYEK